MFRFSLRRQRHQITADQLNPAIKRDLGLDDTSRDRVDPMRYVLTRSPF